MRPKLGKRLAIFLRHFVFQRQFLVECGTAHPIVPALMPCSTDAWHIHQFPDHVRQKNHKARNYAGLSTLYAIKCSTAPNAGSFPFNCFRCLKTRMDSRFLCSRHHHLPSLLPSKNKRFCGCGRWTRSDGRLLQPINRQLSLRTGKPASLNYFPLS